MQPSATYGLNPRTVEGWEQERFGLDRSAPVLFSVIAREPEAVVRSLRKSD
jgi:DNA-binding transcriptional regulator YiaG